MEIKILQVFYDKNGLPYKDRERTVHYPITSGTFLGSSNTTQIRFYYDQLDELNESTFVAVSKLPNGRIGSEILESEYDSELEENYAILNLSQFYTQYKGDVYISLQGYEGGVRVEQDENGVYSILGTPTIAATGSIRMYVAYAPTFIGSGQTENVTLQRVLAELSTKLGIRQETLHVEELPTVGNQNVWYVINDDPNDTTKANIYIWNATRQTYVWVGDNTLNLGDYYTQEEGEQFEQEVRETIGNGSPKGVYATLSDLESAYPTGTNGIYVVSDNGHWYYWNGSAWADGGQYLSSSGALGVNDYINNFNAASVLPDLNDVLENTVYVIDYASNVNISNLPNGTPYGILILTTYKLFYTQSVTVYTQQLYCSSKNKIFTRTKISTYDWSAWKEQGYNENYLVNSGNYSTILTDFNDAVDNEDYFITDMSIQFANKPNDATNGFAILHNYRYFYTSSVVGHIQVFNWSGKTYFRFKNDGGTWGDWTDATDENSEVTWLNTANYSTHVTDWNDVKQNKNYYVSGDTWSRISNSPSNLATDGTIICFKNFYYGTTIYAIAQLIISGNKMFYRTYSTIGSWSSWSVPQESRTKIKIGSSASANYSDLKTGFDAAYLLGNCDVYIEDGIYDLSSSIETIGHGISIGKNNRYFFSSNSKVVCNYTGGNSTVQDENSIFASYQGYGDFEIYNLTAEASNIRYIVHDDNGGNVSEPSRHLFVGCNLKLDNSNHPNKDLYYHCIGGGLGVSSYIELNSCILNSVYVPNGKADAQYHGNTGNNETAQGGKSNLIVKNCYFAHSFSVQNPNNETQKKQLIFSGNSVLYDLVLVNTSSAYWEIYKWNNEIRGS